MKYPSRVSGNPGGRPFGLERRVRELLGAESVDEMTLVLRDIVLGKPRWCKTCQEAAEAIRAAPPTDGKKPPRPNCPCQRFKIATRDRIYAYQVLSDRGWGKPRQQVEILEPNPTDDLARLSNEELVELARIAERTEPGESEGADDGPDPDRPH